MPVYTVENVNNHNKNYFFATWTQAINHCCLCVT